VFSVILPSPAKNLNPLKPAENERLDGRTHGQTIFLLFCVPLSLLSVSKFQLKSWHHRIYVSTEVVSFSLFYFFLLALVPFSPLHGLLRFILSVGHRLWGRRREKKARVKRRKSARQEERDWCDSDIKDGIGQVVTPCITRRERERAKAKSFLKKPPKPHTYTQSFDIHLKKRKGGINEV